MQVGLFWMAEEQTATQPPIVRVTRPLGLPALIWFSDAADQAEEVKKASAHVESQIRRMMEELVE
jgi:hypothetical protein